MITILGYINFCSSTCKSAILYNIISNFLSLIITDSFPVKIYTAGFLMIKIILLKVPLPSGLPRLLQRLHRKECF